MNANDFADQLRKCAPDVANLEQSGLTSADAIEIANMYHCIPRGVTTVAEGVSRQLYALYDVSSVEVGMVRFLKEIREDNGRFQIAKVENDPMYVDLSDGEVYVEQFAWAGHVAWRCAASEAQFLDALALVGCFYGPLDHEDDADNEQRHQKARECAIAAGGERYKNFYLMLLGCQ